MKKLLLFDIDGTILSLKMGVSRQIFADVYYDIFKKRIPDENIPNFAGMTDLHILQEMANLTDIPFHVIESKIDFIWMKLIEKFKLVCNSEYMTIFPGVEHLIKGLHNREDVVLGLLTGNFKENAELKLNFYDIHKYFKVHAYGSDKMHRNDLPPLAISKANKLAGKITFSTSNTLIIGDGPRDVECAKTNNIKVACVSTGHNTFDELAGLKPDLLYHDFSEWEKAMEDFLSVLSD